MARKWRNNGFSTLGAALGSNPSTDTTLSVQVTHGDRFPAVSGGDFFMLSIQNAAGDVEIVKVTARTLGADTMTIVRGQEATVPQAWSINDIVELRLTAGALDDMVSLTEDQTISGDVTFSGDVSLSGTAAFSGAVTFSSTVTGVTAAQTSYDNTDSGLSATDVKAALDELDSDITALSFQADAISYDPSNVSLVATDVQDALDELCTLPTTAKTTDYTLAATDVGGLVSINSGTVTIPAGDVFSAGDVVVIYNDAADARPIARDTGVVLYWIDADDDDRTLAARGLATIVCVGSDTFVITGQGLT